ncbi:uncharacterized protein LOC115719393 isoform X1 [Cannabis sativa]|uniref:uncharacterized protein LOC115719393 isoform X1 n=1 Tax=Cannabis sativa TaxID=3483 RepID=UPI0029CA674C|nr:uncharacterized protein LOC115719393 isoform X1 [Cannabis sativa]
MDYHAMKRKELQALCKTHGIPANLTNREMADRLNLLLKDGEASGSKGLCEIDGEIQSVDVDKKVKKVTFSPDNETFVFVGTDLDSDSDYCSKSKNGNSRKRRATSKNVVVKKNVEVNPVRVTRSRGQSVVEEESKVVSLAVAGRKRGRRGKETVDVCDKPSSVVDGSAECDEGKKEEGVRQLRGRNVVIEAGGNGEEGEVVPSKKISLRGSRKTRFVSVDETLQENLVAEVKYESKDEGGCNTLSQDVSRTEVGVRTRRSKTQVNVAKDDGSNALSQELGKIDVGVGSRRSKTQMNVAKDEGPSALTEDLGKTVVEGRTRRSKRTQMDVVAKDEGSSALTEDLGKAVVEGRTRRSKTQKNVAKDEGSSALTEDLGIAVVEARTRRSKTQTNVAKDESSSALTEDLGKAVVEGRTRRSKTQMNVAKNEDSNALTKDLGEIDVAVRTRRSRTQINENDSAEPKNECQNVLQLEEPLKGLARRPKSQKKVAVDDNSTALTDDLGKADVEGGAYAVAETKKASQDVLQPEESLKGLGRNLRRKSVAGKKGRVASETFAGESIENGLVLNLEPSKRSKMTEVESVSKTGSDGDTMKQLLPDGPSRRTRRNTRLFTVADSSINNEQLTTHETSERVNPSKEEPLKRCANIAAMPTRKSTLDASSQILSKISDKLGEVATKYEKLNVQSSVIAHEPGNALSVKESPVIDELAEVEASTSRNEPDLLCSKEVSQATVNQLGSAEVSTVNNELVDISPNLVVDISPGLVSDISPNLVIDLAPSMQIQVLPSVVDNSVVEDNTVEEGTEKLLEKNASGDYNLVESVEYPNDEHYDLSSIHDEDSEGGYKNINQGSDELDNQSAEKYKVSIQEDHVENANNSQDEKAGTLIGTTCLEYNNEIVVLKEDVEAESRSHFTLEKLQEGSECESPSASNKVIASQHQSFGDHKDVASELNRDHSFSAHDFISMADQVNVEEKLEELEGKKCESPSNSNEMASNEVLQTVQEFQQPHSDLDNHVPLEDEGASLAAQNLMFENEKVEVEDKFEELEEEQESGDLKETSNEITQSVLEIQQPHSSEIDHHVASPAADNLVFGDDQVGFEDKSEKLQEEQERGNLDAIGPLSSEVTKEATTEVIPTLLQIENLNKDDARMDNTLANEALDMHDSDRGAIVGPENVEDPQADADVEVPQTEAEADADVEFPQTEADADVEVPPTWTDEEVDYKNMDSAYKLEEEYSSKVELSIDISCGSMLNVSPSHGDENRSHNPCEDAVYTTEEEANTKEEGNGAASDINQEIDATTLELSQVQANYNDGAAKDSALVTDVDCSIEEALENNPVGIDDVNDGAAEDSALVTDIDYSIEETLERIPVGSEDVNDVAADYSALVTDIDCSIEEALESNPVGSDDVNDVAVPQSVECFVPSPGNRTSELPASETNMDLADGDKERAEQSYDNGKHMEVEENLTMNEQLNETSELHVPSSEIACFEKVVDLGDGEKEGVENSNEVLVEANLEDKEVEENLTMDDQVEEVSERQLGEHGDHNTPAVSKEMISGDSGSPDEKEDACAIIQEYLENETRMHLVHEENGPESEGCESDAVEGVETNSVAEHGFENMLEDGGEEDEEACAMNTERTELEEENGAVSVNDEDLDENVSWVSDNSVSGDGDIGGEEEISNSQSVQTTVSVDVVVGATAVDVNDISAEDEIQEQTDGGTDTILINSNSQAISVHAETTLSEDEIQAQNDSLRDSVLINSQETKVVSTDEAGDGSLDQRIAFDSVEDGTELAGTPPISPQKLENDCDEKITSDIKTLAENTIGRTDNSSSMVAAGKDSPCHVYRNLVTESVEVVEKVNTDKGTDLENVGSSIKVNKDLGTDASRYHRIMLEEGDKTGDFSLALSSLFSSNNSKTNSKDTGASRYNRIMLEEGDDTGDFSPVLSNLFSSNNSKLNSKDTAARVEELSLMKPEEGTDLENVGSSLEASRYYRFMLQNGDKTDDFSLALSNLCGSNNSKINSKDAAACVEELSILKSEKGTDLENVGSSFEANKDLGTDHRASRCHRIMLEEGDKTDDFCLSLSNLFSSNNIKINSKETREMHDLHHSETVQFSGAFKDTAACVEELSILKPEEGTDLNNLDSFIEESNELGTDRRVSGICMDLHNLFSSNDSKISSEKVDAEVLEKVVIYSDASKDTADVEEILEPEKGDQQCSDIALSSQSMQLTPQDDKAVECDAEESLSTGFELNLGFEDSKTFEPESEEMKNEEDTVVSISTVSASVVEVQIQHENHFTSLDELIYENEGSKESVCHESEALEFKESTEIIGSITAPTNTSDIVETRELNENISEGNTTNITADSDEPSSENGGSAEKGISSAELCNVVEGMVGTAEVSNDLSEAQVTSSYAAALDESIIENNVTEEKCNVGGCFEHNKDVSAGFESSIDAAEDSKQEEIFVNKDDSELKGTNVDQFSSTPWTVSSKSRLLKLESHQDYSKECIIDSTIIPKNNIFSVPATPKNLKISHDMKENMPSTKREHFSSFTASKKSQKRRPLENLPNI